MTGVQTCALPISLVFLDNNPAEREQVRQALPQVAVPELAEDPTLYARYLMLGGYFESLAFTKEDRERGGQYLADTGRAKAAASARNLDEYLTSLNMVATVEPFDAVGRTRIAQLISRSNQFNLTTRRYDEAAVRRWEENPKAITLQVRLRDRFGDSGMISVAIGAIEGPDCIIDTWLMSCRVLGRKVEYLVLQELVQRARLRGARRLIGLFLPTERNGLVSDHYAQLGFAHVETAHDGSERWSLELDSFAPTALPIAVPGRDPAAAR